MPGHRTRPAACKIVANAGGLNPAGLAAAVRALADRLGLAVNVAHVEGDDLVAAPPRGWGFGTTRSAANAYLGAWGIVDCLNAAAPTSSSRGGSPTRR